MSEQLNKAAMDYVRKTSGGCLCTMRESCESCSNFVRDRITDAFKAGAAHQLEVDKATLAELDEAHQLEVDKATLAELDEALANLYSKWKAK